MPLCVVRQVVPAGLLDVYAQYCGNNKQYGDFRIQQVPGYNQLVWFAFVIIDGPIHSAAFGNLVDPSHSVDVDLAGCHFNFKIGLVDEYTI